MARNMINLQGTAQLHAALTRAGALAPKAMQAAAVEEMEKVMAESKEQVPVDESILKNSGNVQITKEGGEDRVIAGYGGPAKDYAIEQHENLSLNHTVGGPKFLERPFLQRVPTMATRLAISVGAALRRLGV